MRTQLELLLVNGLYAAAGLGLILVATLIATGLFLRATNLIFLAKSLEIEVETKLAFRRAVWRSAWAFILIMGLVASAGLGIATWGRIYLGDFVHSSWSRLQNRDWLRVGLAASKALGILLFAFVSARLLLTALHYVRERLQRAELLTGHQERLSHLLDRLRKLLSTTIVLGSLILCAQLLDLPESGRRLVWSIFYVGVAGYLGRFAVGATHLTIDVFFGLSESLSRLASPLRYLGRLRHLSKLTKRAADYFIYVGIGTWTIEQITPGTWAAQTGRLGLRIIAIFYLCRVFIEVCLLLMNEFFLVRDNQNQAEFQQRQTLVPVAASLLRYSIYFTAVVMSLREAGIDPTPLLAGAGVAGVAVGLGAQSFVGDIVAGFFILFENLFLVGDLIEVSGVKGKVEEIAVRVTKVRDDSGVLHAIPNGEVRKVSSHSKDFVNVIVDIPVPYGENVHDIFAVLREKMVAVRASQPDILGETEFGLEDLRESTMVLRTVTMVKPGLSSEMTDILRLALWEALDTAGVSAPYARRMLLSPPQGAPRATSLKQRTAAAAVQRTDIQRLKAHNFYLALDVDDNGHLEQADVDALGRRLLENQPRRQGSAVQSRLQSSLLGYWEEMVKFVDGDQDGRVSKEEFIQFCIALPADLSGPAGSAIQTLSDVLFTVCDRNDAGLLSENDFTLFARAYGLSERVASAGFRLIDRNGNGQITKEEWLRFMRDVFISRKLNDAAAVVFGPGCRND